MRVTNLTKENVEARIVSEALTTDKKYSCGGTTCPKGKKLCCFYCEDIFTCNIFKSGGGCMKAIDVDLEEFKVGNIPIDCESREVLNFEDIEILEEIV